MAELSFPHVNIKTQTGGQVQTVASVDAALDFLLNHWPDTKGRKFNTARRACLDAMEGRQTPEAARTAFVKAAQEADIYVKERTP